jgi:hypothetical protein
MNQLPRPPTGLNDAGRRFWSAVLTEYELDEAHLERLRRICEDVSLLARERASLAKQPLLVAGSKGQRIVNPLASEIRLLSLAVEKQIAALLVPADDPGKRGREGTASDLGRKMALLRHHGA